VSAQPYEGHYLIVDDNGEYLDSLRDILVLKNRTWKVSTASSVEAARGIIEGGHPEFGPVDVVLTDLVMQFDGMAGLKVMEIARRHDPLMMVVLFTAKEKAIDRYAAMEHGAFDVIEKTYLGAEAWREISVKANAAYRFRMLALDKVEQSRLLTRRERFFYPGIFEALRADPSVLDLKMRMLTTMFWDIRGFPRVCETLKTQPVEIQRFLRSYYEAATRCIFDHSGIVVKLLGDGVAALFMGFAERGDGGRQDAENAVTAALKLRAAFDGVVEEYVSRWPGNIVGEIDLRCGIHTGEALVGMLGLEFHDQFTALGVNVNVAGELLAHAGLGEVLVSQATLSRLGAAFHRGEERLLDLRSSAAEFRVCPILGLAGGAP